MPVEMNTNFKVEDLQMDVKTMNPLKAKWRH